MNDWAGFLALAKTLAQALPAEGASLRSAISRAYYSAYNDARQYLRSKDLNYNLSRNDSQHEKVWTWFSSQYGRVTQVATLGEALRKKRNNADYESTFPNLKYEAGDSVQKAQRILVLLADARTPPVRPPSR